MRRHFPAILTSVVAVAAISLLAAGCGGGGGSGPGVASVSSSTVAASATAQTGALGYAVCMRSHGVPSFPDPNSQGRFPSLPALGLSKQTWAPADSACKHLLPNRGSGPQETAQQARTKLADELSFARCMRSHGVSGFPDPTAQGQLTVEMVEAQGIDVHSPAVLEVVQACLPASHGGLTAAKVRAALANVGG